MGKADWLTRVTEETEIDANESVNDLIISKGGNSFGRRDSLNQRFISTKSNQKPYPKKFFQNQKLANFFFKTTITNENDLDFNDIDEIIVNGGRKISLRSRNVSILADGLRDVIKSLGYYPAARVENTPSRVVVKFGGSRVDYEIADSYEPVFYDRNRKSSIAQLVHSWVHLITEPVVLIDENKRYIAGSKKIHEIWKPFQDRGVVLEVSPRKGDGTPEQVMTFRIFEDPEGLFMKYSLRYYFTVTDKGWVITDTPIAQSIGQAVPLKNGILLEDVSEAVSLVQKLQNGIEWLNKTVDEIKGRFNHKLWIHHQGGDVVLLESADGETTVIAWFYCVYKENGLGEMVEIHVGKEDARSEKTTLPISDATEKREATNHLSEMMMLVKKEKRFINRLS